MAEQIEQKLRQAFAPVHVQVDDESYAYLTAARPVCILR